MVDKGELRELATKLAHMDRIEHIQSMYDCTVTNVKVDLADIKKIERAFERMAELGYSIERVRDR